MSLLDSLMSKVRTPIDLGKEVIDFDAPNPSTVVVEAEAKTKLLAYTKPYYEWIKPKAEKLITSMHELVKQSSGGCTCKLCKDEVNPATGEVKSGYYWHFNKQMWLPCGRCAGKGFTTKIDDSRHETWKSYDGKRDFSWSKRPAYAPC